MSSLNLFMLWRAFLFIVEIYVFRLSTSDEVYMKYMKYI